LDRSEDTPATFVSRELGTTASEETSREDADSEGEKASVLETLTGSCSSSLSFSASSASPSANKVKGYKNKSKGFLNFYLPLKCFFKCDCSSAFFTAEKINAIASLYLLYE